ncbi:PhoD-like phosphatase [filamentous cyanobacterium LEGE 11480]|uniref:PhoD-like phosphatase n=1 Tax=Romeriopsis navalis LEGE 11480 TaxID=2777977 RepID=A0A928VSK2_9CYAN|nr:PhoD-like phosphatase [Romeriopsis navalis]MBE9031439.1 PhoD-like phosphatase [Romeriopsis navalis LEGE 11480]
MLRTTAKLDLTQLPLILSGPILRRTESTSVTVWLAVQRPCQVKLHVMPHEAIGTARPQLRGTASTIAIGKAIHILAITAYAVDEQRLTPNQLYAYDLVFQLLDDGESDTEVSLGEALRSSAFPDVAVSYFDHGLPTFALPPPDLNDVKVIHGSCRKVHDQGLDALPIIDQLLVAAADNPAQRPHQLFLTGDQIYGDEVAAPFLWGIQQFSPILFGWTEIIAEGADVIFAANLRPGKRQSTAEAQAGLTASLQGDEEKTNSHLLSFSEYCISYLFAWSECLWHLEFPQAESVGRKGQLARRWNQSIQHLASIAQSQSSVRRALANVPTYMIFDDHDVSDDWNLNQAWCLRVLGKSLGRQVVRNALSAYALFQAWGNTPEQFLPGTIGDQLLQAVQGWYKASGDSAAHLAIINQAIGMPLVDPLTDLPEFELVQDVLVLKRPPESLEWHYRIRATAYEVLVLDTRTQRGYPIDAPTDAPPQLLSPIGFQDQLHPMLQASQQEATQPDLQLTFVVAPTNVFTLEILDRLQALGQAQGKAFDMDIGDAWNLEGKARPQLLKALFQARSQIVVLSGDIHFGAALCVDYWATPNSDAKTWRKAADTPDAQLVQLIASAICNSEPVTAILHTKLKTLLLERRRYWVGYPQVGGETEITPLAWWDWLGCWQYLRLKYGRWFTGLKQHKLDEKIRQPLPSPHTAIDWGYSSRWLPRAASQQPDWEQSPKWLRNSLDVQAYAPNIWQRLWNSAWWQAGPEVVGLNNIGLVQFAWPDNSTAAPILLYDLYWYAPWQSPHIVYSRFQTPLRPHITTIDQVHQQNHRHRLDHESPKADPKS